MQRTLGSMLVLLLVACGGGQQVEKFAPNRVISFGDETSVIDSSGAKYTVNAVNATTGALDCASNPVWNQYLASAFGLVFPQCNPQSVATTSQIYASFGATVNDVKTQIDQFIAKPDSFGGKDLVTILAGQHDVLAQYELVKGGTITEAQATDAVEQAGTFLAGQVNRVAQAGGKVLIVTVIDQGTTPFALAEEAAMTGRAALLSRLTNRFNSKLRIGLINDGRMIGLILADEAFSSIVKNIISFVDVKTPACDAAHIGNLLTCTTATLVTGASAETWLWADTLHLSAGGQRTLGAMAVTRATGNPF